MAEKKINIPVGGMSCANCATNIERSVKKLSGVTEAHVNFAAEQAAISYDSQKLQLKDVVDKINGSGYSVALSKVEIMPKQGFYRFFKH